MIVMSTHGYGGFRRFLLGSVTAKILHDVSCPVFTGAHVGEMPPFGAQPYQRIGCAIDLGDHSEELLRGAEEFARSWDARLVVIHATPFVDVIFDSTHVVTADWRDMVVGVAREKVGDLLRTLGCEADTFIGNGHPVHRDSRCR